MVAMKRIGTISVLAVPVLVMASVLGRHTWSSFPSPSSGRESEAFARQDALAMAGVGFVTRKVVQNRNAGPVQFYPHEKRIYDIAPRAKLYVRERQELVAAVELGYRREVHMKGTGECET
ncbi:hypothetical protein [Burkholderia ubonensis]|uniref:hypothetical protein n=1 Tax=Burkholderia ubonensis TaxID=101571 RepID=UPI000AAA7C38|nr:hypothetical protein [Burkholderia ubonensis]